MNYFYEPKEIDRVHAARESFSGRLLSDAQFDEAMAITNIIEREIQKAGAFKEKLGDYAYAFARTENFDAMKSETIIRDLFRARTGQSMNQMREALTEREQKLPDNDKSLARQYARAVGTMIQDGDKINFHRAYAHQAAQLAGELNITDAGAKRLIKDEFAAAEGREFYEWGKEIEERFYRPQIEAEKEQRLARSEEGAPARDRGDDGGRRVETADNASARREKPRSRQRMEYRR